MSNSVRLNLKSGEITPYWTVAANTWVPEQLPASLDSAKYEIGQLSSGLKGWHWTAPGMKSDSCPVAAVGAGDAVSRAGRVDALGMRSVGWLSLAEGAGAGFRRVIVAAVGEAVRDRFAVVGDEGHFHGGIGELAGGVEAVLWHWARLDCTSSRVVPDASITSAGQWPEMNRPDGLTSTAPSRAEFRNGMPLVWSLGV